MDSYRAAQLFNRNITTFDTEDTTCLEYDIAEENKLEMAFFQKKFEQKPTDLQTIKHAKEKLSLEDVPQNQKYGIAFDVDNSTTSDFMQNYNFKKRLAYMANPRLLTTLDVDVRSIDGIKFYGTKPLVTLQYDKKTKLRCGLSLMPGSFAFVLGASRQISNEM